jgi:hypothetical protein
VSAKNFLPCLLLVVACNPSRIEAVPPTVLTVPPAVLTVYPTGERIAPPGLDVPASADPTLTELPEEVIDYLHLSGLKIVMNEMGLGEVVSAFGGNLTHQGDAGSSMDRVCYELEDSSVIWLGSSGLGGPEMRITEYVLGENRELGPTTEYVPGRSAFLERIGSSGLRENRELGPTTDCLGIQESLGGVEIEHGLTLGMSESEFRRIFQRALRSESGEVIMEWMGQYQLLPRDITLDYYAGVAATIQKGRVVRLKGWLTQTNWLTPLAEPGSYTLTMTLGDHTYTQNIQVDRKGEYKGEANPFAGELGH